MLPCNSNNSAHILQLYMNNVYKLLNLVCVNPYIPHSYLQEQVVFYRHAEIRNSSTANFVLLLDLECKNETVKGEYQSFSAEE